MATPAPHVRAATTATLRSTPIPAQLPFAPHRHGPRVSHHAGLVCVSRSPVNARVAAPGLKPALRPGRRHARAARAHPLLDRAVERPVCIDSLATRQRPTL